MTYKCDNEDESNNDRCCKCPHCEIFGSPDLVFKVTGSIDFGPHDPRWLTNRIFRRRRPFSFGINRPKVIPTGSFITRCPHTHFPSSFKKPKSYSEAQLA